MVKCTGFHFLFDLSIIFINARYLHIFSKFDYFRSNMGTSIALKL